MSEPTPPQDIPTIGPSQSFFDQFGSLEVPVNIDPRLLELWVLREQEELAKGQEHKKKVEPNRNRRLTWLYASFVGILLMCISIILGLIHGLEMEDILKQTCQVFLLFTIIGFIAGWIIEYCVADSVESLLREAVKRSQEAAETKRARDAAAVAEALRRG